ncbi:hypothetical protein OBBRIDRAFT_313230 [Obba rivulosa]|uniref:Uncharacterized protein n=1 Tax=Obba rivulosa TaxID=1052685 RepID=A0A8E2DK49_9APHY|nr:hypothetical protein OBBRIDRAFT_313230 [Obba rivulosa]
MSDERRTRGRRALWARCKNPEHKPRGSHQVSHLAMTRDWGLDWTSHISFLTGTGLVDPFFLPGRPLCYASVRPSTSHQDQPLHQVPSPRNRSLRQGGSPSSPLVEFRSRHKCLHILQATKTPAPSRKLPST